MNGNRIIVLQYFGLEVGEDIVKEVLNKLVTSGYIRSTNVSVTQLDSEDIAKIVSKPLSKEINVNITSEDEAIDNAAIYIAQICKDSSNISEFTVKLLKRASDEYQSDDVRMRNAMNIIIKNYSGHTRLLTKHGLTAKYVDAIKAVYNSIY